MSARSSRASCCRTSCATISPDRHPRRLRARRVRHLHRAARRRDRALLPHARRAGGRRRDPHRRGPRHGRGSCTRSRRRSGRSRGCSAASARPGCCCSALELLEAKSQPSRDDIGEGIAGNLCRCTGYQYIIDAVERAAELDDARQGGRGMTTEPHPAEPAAREAGARHPLDRQDHQAGRGPAPAGRPRRYIADMALPGMLHAAVLRSPHAHARIGASTPAEARRRPASSR